MHKLRTASDRIIAAKPLAGALLLGSALLIAASVLLMVLPEGASHAIAQEVSIKVLVNDDPISDYDIDQRERFLGITTQQQPSADLKKQATDLLIDERLQMQQARKLGITPDDDDMMKILVRHGAEEQSDRGRTYHGARQGWRQHQDAEGPHSRAARLASGRAAEVPP